MTEKERIQGEIKILQSKLALLEEMEKHKSPVEEAYKRVYGNYPDTGICNGMSYVWWDVFCKGYNASQKDYKVGEYEPTPQEPEENKWKTVALRFGETLSSIGPCGYYGMTADEWLEWANDTYEKNADELLPLVQRGIRKNEVKEHQPKEKEQKWGDIVRESVKWCEEHPDESVEDYLKPQGPQGPVGPGPGPKGVIVGYEPTPQEPEENKWKTVALRFGKKLPVIPPYGYDELSPNAWFRWVVFTYDDYISQRDIESGYHPAPWTPEQTEKSLREAFKKVQQTEEWKETQRKIDSNYDDMVKNPPEFLKFELGKTLEALITRWWDDVLYGGIHQDWDREVAIDDLIDQIQLWLPREQSHEGTQSASVIDLVDGYNDALTKIKSKLRNKK